MTRNARTKQFRKEIQEEYFNNLIEECENNSNNFFQKKIFYDNFEHIYDNKVIVEKAIELEIIVWSPDEILVIFIPFGLLFQDDISKHPNLQLKWIERFPEKKWDWFEISRNPNLELSWIERFPEKKWDWFEISRNPNLELSWIERFPEKKWDWFEISRNPNLELSWIERFPEKKWDWFEISRNPNLELSWIERFPKKNWNWENISKHLNLQLEWIERFPKKNWNWENISKHLNLQLKWIERFPEKKWDWFEISRNPNLELSWIERFPEKKWDWENISKHPNLQLKWIERFPKKNWNWENISKHLNLQLEWIERFPNKPWYFCKCNPEFKFLKANLISKIFENIILYSNILNSFNENIDCCCDTCTCNHKLNDYIKYSHPSLNFPLPLRLRVWHECQADKFKNNFKSFYYIQNPETEIILKKKRNSWKNILKLYNTKLSKQLKISIMMSKRY